MTDIAPTPDVLDLVEQFKAAKAKQDEAEAKAEVLGSELDSLQETIDSHYEVQENLVRDIKAKGFTRLAEDLDVGLTLEDYLQDIACDDCGRTDGTHNSEVEH